MNRTALTGPCKPCPALEGFKRRQGHKAQLNLPLDLALGLPLPLCGPGERLLGLHLPGTQQGLPKYVLA